MIVFTVLGLLAWIPAIRVYIAARRAAHQRWHWILTATAAATAFISLAGFAWWWFAFGHSIALANLGLGGFVCLVAATSIWWHIRVLHRRQPSA
ncbi:MAG TPA: hypothetical protein VMT90_07610 [Dehalococcoidia bacterium]|jgi:hypothetical protein|nr:hypothetical protein [Dehalococcoidia bacterium]